MADAVADDPFVGPGEMAALCRARDWSQTALGPVEHWPEALRGAVRNCLASPFPTNLWCGSELVLVYNDAYRRVLGIKHPAALGKPGREVWAEIWDVIGPMFQQIREGGPPIWSEDAPFLLQRADEGGDPDLDGPNAWFTFSLSPVRDEEGALVAFLNLVYETTARVRAERDTEAARERAERAEARLMEIFDHAPAFMAVLRGEDHIFEYVNNAYYDLVGSRELLGRPALDALPEVRGQGYEDLLARVLATGETYVGRERPVLLARSPDHTSEERFVDLVYYAIEEADGTRSGIVAHGSDVTEHVRARQEAQRARGEAEEASKAKSQFLASMSHELRTPINAVVGYVDLLQMGIPGPLTERQRDHLDRVRSSSRHLLMLIDDILDLTKVEAGQMDLRRERVDVAGPVAEALALVGPQARERDIRIENACEEGPEVMFTGDEDRVRQILVNILSNAVKFTSPGGDVRVVAGTRPPPDSLQAAEDERMTFVAISDTGIGIPPNEMDRIFDPFTQGEGGVARTHGGTGLGLTISRQLAELMGGGLTAMSRPGEGSTFTVWLPN